MAKPLYAKARKRLKPFPATPNNRIHFHCHCWERASVSVFVMERLGVSPTWMLVSVVPFILWVQVQTKGKSSFSPSFYKLIINTDP